VQTIAVPRRFSQIAKNIWTMQPRFSNIRGKQPQRLFSHPNFRAAYDFFCIQSMVGLTPHQLCQWWTDFQTQQPAAENQQAGPKRNPGHRPRRRRRKRKPTNESS
jgi:poly(A) polymerase